jgi:hypothetical protein
VSEMVERVAQAIGKSRFGESLRWHQETGGLRQSCLDDARAAITAMREPTKPMIDAGDYVIAVISWDGELVWRAMVDEALK